MTGAGRPPVPNERKRLLGNPGKRALPDLRSVDSMAPAVDADAPSFKTDEARQIWRSVVGLPWVGKSDTLILEHLCEIEDRRQQFIEKLVEDGPTLVTDKGYVYAHPIVAMVSKLDEEKRKLFSMLGLSPADRTQLGLAEVKAQSKLEQMMARKASGS